MKDLKNKEEFIQLRAQGLSFDKISKEIGISKPTLIKWNQECADAVANSRYFNVESLLEQHKLIKTLRLDVLARTLNKALDELSKRNFENVPTKDLIPMIFAVENKLKEELIGVRFHTGVLETVLDIESNFVKEKTVPIFY